MVKIHPSELGVFNLRLPRGGWAEISSSCPTKKVQPQPDTIDARCVWGGMNELNVVVRVVEAQDGERRTRLLNLLAAGLQRSFPRVDPAAVDFGGALSVYGDVRDDEEAARW